MRIAGHVALVTGAAAGTGRAIARRLEERGATVVTADLSDGIDVTDDAQLEALIADARPDILVNNAGGGGHVPPHFPEATKEQWSALLDLNLRAPMLATQLALAPMRRDGAGAIVNVASTAGLGDEPYASPEYGAAKAGLIRFTSALAAVGGVRVNCVVPDWVATERLTAEERAATPPPIPLERVAAAVLDLIRDDAAAGRAVELWRGQGGELSPTDIAHLRRCVALAQAAIEVGDEPFGSVLVDADGAVRFEDHNHEAGGDHTQHPELAIARWAAEHLTPEERAAATVYTSGEHCPMCAAAHGWVGLGRIVYASSTEQLTAWRAQLGLPAGPVRPLPIRSVVSGARVDGPVPELAAAVRALHVRFHTHGG